MNLTRRQFGKWVMRGGLLVPFVAPLLRGGTIIVRGPVMAAVAGGGAPATEFITGQTLGSPRTDGGNLWTGFKFTVGGAGITVTELGRWNWSGDSQSHNVYIADASGNILGSVTIDAALGSPGGFQYVALGSPVALSASATYAVVSREPNGDHFGDSNTVVTNTAAGVILESVYVFTSGGTINGAGQSGCSYGPVSFKYT